MDEAPIKIDQNAGITSTNKIEEYSKYLPGALKAIEERFSIFFVAVGLVGYIIISAFGKMDSLGKFLGYIVFLSLCWLYFQLYTRHVSKYLLVLLVLALVFLLGYLVYQPSFIDYIKVRL